VPVYLSQARLNRNAYDQCVLDSTQHLPYALSWWLDVVSPGWGAVVEPGAEGYRAVLPVPLISKLGAELVQQPFFTQQLGLFTSEEGHSLPAFLACLPAPCWPYQLQAGKKGELHEAVMSLMPEFEVQERITHWLDLNPAYQDIRACYHTNLRRNLKRAQLTSYRVTKGTDLRDLIKLFRSTKGQTLPEVKHKHYLQLAKLCKAVHTHGTGQVLEIRQQGQLICGGFFVEAAGMLIYLFGATSEAARNTGAMSMLIDNVIEQRAGHNLTLDFEGSMVASVARFYQSFGAQPIPYLSLKSKELPWRLKWLLK
jgi:hypothetical protein